ncbi:TolC family protein [Desulfosoma caldarium]|uniref:Outer membrane protein TolC n=1 Tax=Desulfosoma caldarium TaxID=610254 RepID=A0A3N1UIF1_9BACT|nr:TolC family protein [Desulfosoma caldarium]ROQ91042.1 outer membrane protein TolC [Desulfosoma caldarium]
MKARGNAGALIGTFVFLCLVFSVPSRASNPEPAAAPMVPSTAEAPAGTLAHALQTALAHHPKISMANLKTQAAEAGRRAAQAGYYPRISLSHKILRSNNPVFVFGSLLEQARFGEENFDPAFLNAPNPLTNARTEAVASLSLFDQLYTATRVAEGQGAQNKARFMEDWVRQEIFLGVIRSFYGVRVARERVGVAEDAVKETKAQVRRIQDLFENGQVVRSDLLAAQVQHLEFSQQLVEAQGHYATAQAAFQTALGRPSPPYPEPTQKIPSLLVPLHSLSHYTEEALASRPDVAMVREDLRVARLRLREARARYLPRVDAFSSYGVSGPDWESGSSDYTLGLAFRWDLYEGQRRPGIDQALALVAAAEAQVREAEDQVRLQVVEAFESLRAARERLNLSLQAVAQAREALRIVRDRYAEGLTTITEVLRAETAYRRAQWMELGARYDHVVRYAELLFRTGRLHDAAPFEG